MSAQTPAKIDLSKYIETRLCEDRPHIRKRRIPVAQIARRMRVEELSVPQRKAVSAAPRRTVLTDKFGLDRMRDCRS